MSAFDEFDPEHEEFPFNARGTSTCGYLVCALCGTKYNKPPDEEDPDGWVGEDFVRRFDFGPAEIGPCCFRALEEAIHEIFPKIVGWERFTTLQRLAEARKEAMVAVDGQAVLHLTD